MSRLYGGLNLVISTDDVFVSLCVTHWIKEETFDDLETVFLMLWTLHTHSLAFHS